MSGLKRLIHEIHRRSRCQVLAAVRHRSAVACGFYLALLAVVGCSRGDDPAYSRGSTVSVAYCCGPAALNTSTEMPAKFLVFLPLVGYDENGERTGRLARSWEHSPDYREWTYHLRTDVRWHDGVPFTAHDVKFTLDLLTHPDVPDLSPGYIESIAVLDDSTITLRSTAWESASDDGWVVYYPKHLLEELDPKEFTSWEFWTQPVGNGPYRFVRYLAETFMEFEANPDYYRGVPTIERVVLKFLGDAGPGLTELLSGNVDAIPYAKPAQIPLLAADPRFSVYYEIRPSWPRAIYWQNDHPFFRDPRVRRALTLSINRRELLQVLNLPETLPLIDGVYTPRQFRRGQLPEPLPYDPARARALLDDAGWRDRNGDGVREQEGKEFRFTAIVPATGGWEHVSVYVQEQLRRVGVRMGVQTLESGIVFGRVEAGEFEAAFMPISNASWWLQQYFGEHSPLGYENAEVVEFIDRLQVTADPDARDRIYGELMQIFRADMPVTFLFPWVVTHFVHRRIQGLSSPYRTDPVRYMEDLWLEEEN